MDKINLPVDTRIARADLKVSNLERALGYYQNRLGFRLIERHTGEARLSANGQPPYLIRLVELAGARSKPAQTTGLFHLAIRLPDRTALADLLLHLIENRMEIQGASDHLVSEAIYLADPDANGLELYVDRPRERWPRSGDQIAMTTAPLNFEDLLNQASSKGAGWEGIHPRTDIGHIHLQVADLAQTEDFYHNRLGFEVTQRSYPGALFFAAGGYHHHIGTNIWSSRGAPPPPPDATGLISFAIQIPGKENDFDISSQLEKNGVALAWRNDSDQTRVLTVQDPSANIVELMFVTTNSG